jgi:hypothetical protein
MEKSKKPSKPIISWMEVADFYYYFFIILSGVRLSPLGTAATTGLLYQPQMVLAGNLPQRHFVYHKSHMTRPRLEPGPPQWEVSD